MKITMIKKITAVLLILFIVIGLCSCNIFDVTDVIQETSTESKATKIIENVDSIKNSDAAETTTNQKKMSLIRKIL